MAVKMETPLYGFLVILHNVLKGFEEHAMANVTNRLLSYEDCTAETLMYRCMQNAMIRLVGDNHLVRILGNLGYLYPNRYYRAILPTAAPWMISYAYNRIFIYCKADLCCDIMALLSEEYGKGSEIINTPKMDTR